MRKRILPPVTALAVLVMTSPVSAEVGSLEESLNENKKAQAVAKESIENVKEQSLHVTEQIKKEEKEVQKLDRYIKKTEEALQEKSKELAEIEKYIKELEKQQENIESLLSEREDEFRERAAAYYKNGNNISFLDVLFDNSTFSELIGRLSSYTSIVDADRNFIEEYINDQEKVSVIKEKTATLKKRIEVMKQTAEELKTSYETSKNKQVSTVASLEEKKKTLRAEEKQKELALREFEKEAVQINEKIQKEERLAAEEKQRENEIADYSDSELVTMVADAKEEARNPFKSPVTKYPNKSVNSVITPFVADAQRIKTERGIPASIILGQIILESSGRYNGLSGLAYQGKNLYGVKGTGTAGSIYMNTTEYVNGKKITVKAKFAKYATYYDSMQAHADLLMKERYQKHLRHARTIEEYAQGIKKGGYATDPNYARLLVGVIEKYGLRQYD
ncbi:glucosaminidase domain-containing protein [Pseudobacillus sp. 179-B 2D1 NHS]|uniref:glucosaminidase domain-containing protein n=1 Tax=Pseudobacillus sp. 179-B 2D1 NHS TaxID=3374292 RepID=UPI00387A6E1D